MNSLSTALRSGRPFFLALVPLILWAMLWFGLNAGLAHKLFEWQGLSIFLNRLRAVVPLLAGYLAMMIILVNLARQRPGSFTFISPLGLSVLYGLVGVVSAIAFSPSSSQALFWSAAYISVPFVLWGAFWGPGMLENLPRIINFNWLIIFIITGILFVIGLVYVDLGSEILSPSAWPKCNLYATWYSDTSEVLRPTMVGRFAALAGIIALARVWQGNWRMLWGLILIAAFVLLFTSGARTAMIGFAAALILMVLIHGNKKMWVAGAVAGAASVLFILFTGTGHSLADDCFLNRVVEATPLASNLPPPVLEEKAVPPSDSNGIETESQSSAVSESQGPAIPITVVGETVGSTSDSVNQNESSSPALSTEFTPPPSDSEGLTAGITQTEDPAQSSP